VKAIVFEGATAATPAPGVLEALANDALEATVICPSNPYLSIDPMLAIPKLRAALARRRVPVIAVSPLIGGQAVKGPTSKIMRELGIDAGPAAIAHHYAGLIDGLVIDRSDEAAGRDLPVPAFVTDTLMRTLDDRMRLACFCLERARELRLRMPAG
jgi:LPPG:FO 2-phospho-L-lactate transferase